jgi:hypothetical protein
MCKKPREKFDLPLCIECSPYMYKKQRYPHQKLRRQKIWSEKRSQKLQEANNTCEWCGKTEAPFSIHHSEEVNSRTYEYIWERVLEDRVNEFINKTPDREAYSINFLLYESIKNLRKAKKYFEHRSKEEVVLRCPNCTSTNYITRKTIAPKYKCNSCKSEFNRLKIGPSKITIHNLKNFERKIANEKSKINFPPEELHFSRYIWCILLDRILPHFYKDCKIEYEKEVQKLLDEYLDFGKTLVLCRKCHNAISKGLRLCNDCKEHYHNIRYDRCYECNQKELAKKNPFAAKLREFFNLSLYEYEEIMMEIDCLKCGDFTFEQDKQYYVYLTEDELRTDSSIGCLCKSCYQKYQHIKEKKYFVKEI